MEYIEDDYSCIKNVLVTLNSVNRSDSFCKTILFVTSATDRRAKICHHNGGLSVLIVIMILMGLQVMGEW